MLSTDFIKKSGGYLATLLCLLCFISFSNTTFAQLPAGALACNNSVQVSLDNDCEAEITPAMILEGEDEDDLDNYYVTIEGVVGTVVSVPGTYTVTVHEIGTGNSCWGYIHVEDKLPPVIEECPCEQGNDDPDCEFRCTDLNRLVTGALATPQPDVFENCSGLISDFQDEVTDGADCGQKIVTRYWTFKDAAGNTTNGCVQEFRLNPIDLDDVKEPTPLVEVPCGTDVSMPSLLSYFTPIVGVAMARMNAYPTVNGRPLTEAVCNLVVTKADIVLPVCEQSCSNSIKVFRDWTVLDWCSGEVVMYSQIIKAVDQEAPIVEAEDITVSTDAWSCEGSFFMPAPTVLYDQCTDFVEYRVQGPAGTTITYNNANQLWMVSGAPKGVNTFSYIAYDCCENEAVYNVEVTVEDRVAPVAIAKEFVTTTLTNGGIAKVFAPSIDNGSHDGCTDVHIEVRRDTDNCDIQGNDTYNNDGHPEDHPLDPDQGEYVKFCCEDVTALEVDVNGDGELDAGYIKVWLRVWDDADMNGLYGTSGDNYNETWSFVKVEDKLAPTIVCPPDVTIQCNHDENNLDKTGTAVAFATCGDIPVDYTDNTNGLNECGAGVITRRWFVVGESQIRCTQRIYKDIDYFTGSNINWPESYTTNCLDLANNGDVPTWSAPACAQIGYSIESDTFVVEEDACLKIINQWTLVDWCQYDPNATYSTGMWSHTQVIKVKDEEAPVLNCANTMYPVDENCELVNPVLTAVADDNGDCSSKWLKWTALVDLWGDGTYDYEFSESLPFFDNNFNRDDNNNGIPDVYLAPTSSGEEVSITLPVTVPSSMSNHKIKWKVTDGCGNYSECQHTFMITDKKAPTPYCIGISSALMDNGEVQLWAIDFDLGSFDNCTEEGDLRFTFTETRPNQDPAYIPAFKSSARTFTCSDIEESNEIIVDVYVWDEKNNRDYCTVALTLEDNQGACGDGPDLGRIAGTVYDVQGESMANVEVHLSTDLPEHSKTVASDVDGGYIFPYLPMTADYTLSGSYDHDVRKGINTLDIVLIQRHILEIESFSDPYQTIASDVTGDEKVTAADLLSLRKLILGISQKFSNQPSYLVLDANHTYNDIDHPWPLADKISVDNMASEVMGQDLVSIKMGDINRDGLGLHAGKGTNSRSKSTLHLDAVVESGLTELVVTKEVSAAGIQLALDLKGASLLDVQSDVLDITADNYTVDAGIMYFSWSEALNTDIYKGQTLLAITTDQEIAVELAAQDLLNSEAYIGHDLSTVDIAITKRSADEKLIFEVQQNEPNPFKEVTTVTYTLPQDGKVQFTVVDMNGKLVLSESLQGAKGENTYTVEMKTATSGVYFYTIESGVYTATHKMIMID